MRPETRSVDVWRELLSVEEVLEASKANKTPPRACEGAFLQEVTPGRKSKFAPARNTQAGDSSALAISAASPGVSVPGTTWTTTPLC